jgi:hypothetical protein
MGSPEQGTVSLSPAYPAARVIARKVQDHFARHLAAAPAEATAPAAADVEFLVDAAFWASLRREEGFIPKISFALLPPDRAVHPLLLEQPLPVAAIPLVRVAPAVERPGIHLGVSRDSSGELRVWGTTRSIPAYCMVLEVAAPGLLVIKHHRGDGGKFVNVAVLEGDRVKMIDESASRLPDCPALLTTLLGLDTAGSWHGSTNVLVELAVSMRTHGRGGALLMVPAGTDAWLDSIVQPIAYRVDPPFRALAELVRRAEAERSGREWQDELAETVAAVGGLTAVDGATLLTDGYDLLAFGAKISRARGRPVVDQIVITEPIEGVQPEVVSPSRLGNTRHLSAAQFIQDQRDAIALVASVDGRFTVFAWSPCEEMVHAHRVESLLL